MTKQAKITWIDLPARKELQCVYLLWMHTTLDNMHYLKLGMHVYCHDPKARAGLNYQIKLFNHYLWNYGLLNYCQKNKLLVN